jgi:hypothetical protein
MADMVTLLGDHLPISRRVGGDRLTDVSRGRLPPPLSYSV